MKLVVFLLLVGWYAAAKRIQKSGKKAAWQMRCLSCNHVQPATSAKLIRNAEPGKTKYTLATCVRCHRISGVAIEPISEADESESVAA